LLGTPGFVAPEAASSNAPRERSVDLFGLGAVLRACLDALPLDARSKDLPMLAEWLCAENPAARPDSATELQTFLETMGPRL
jgi:serine/threonine protein kinase